MSAAVPGTWPIRVAGEEIVLTALQLCGLPRPNQDRLGKLAELRVQLLKSVFAPQTSHIAPCSTSHSTYPSPQHSLPCQVTFFRVRESWEVSISVDELFVRLIAYFLQE